MAAHQVKLHGQALVAAFQFLTRLPIPITVPFESPVLTRSVLYFPIAGAFIGAVVAAAGWLLQLFLPPWPAAVLLLALWTALSGGLHMDGWMDTADGVLSHRSRERMLEIMKDSRVGAMGVLAAVLLLLFKASLLAELLADERPGLVLPLIAAAPIWGRAWMAIAIAGWPNARQGEGIGALFVGVRKSSAVLSLVIGGLITCLCILSCRQSFETSILMMLACLLSTLVVGGALAIWLTKKLGGLTGDTYGAMNEAVEAVILLTAVITLGTTCLFL
ncbi:adenosylcobinamide-GDP ribazoletransferase [Paenibacillus harenae]|uniref:Adenosylcobinamide-GDP ribazoletransferase n=1 Tax=Paenibacillus harenae TaxID=306543 RepID=A0ABT9UDB8_PAEHA|nr:adenosylcobinamide-GDP ribazoletransferase [Paenibacillus harenae]MDQ0116665.1 adenosylcobinamide-GDP ribazoletransferase [Paenibacillus harenae]